MLHLDLLKRGGINCFILFALTAIMVGSCPLRDRANTPLLGTLSSLCEPFLRQSGLAQQWDMLATTPPKLIDQRLGIRAEITLEDGTRHSRDLLTIERAGFRARTHFSRLRRFFSEIDLAADPDRLWTLLAERLCRSEFGPTNPAVLVRFIETTSPMLTVPSDNEAAWGSSPAEKVKKTIHMAGRER